VRRVLHISVHASRRDPGVGCGVYTTDVQERSGRRGARRRRLRVCSCTVRRPGRGSRSRDGKLRRRGPARSILPNPRGWPAAPSRPRRADRVSWTPGDFPRVACSMSLRGSPLERRAASAELAVLVERPGRKGAPVGRWVSRAVMLGAHSGEPLSCDRWAAQGLSARTAAGVMFAAGSLAPGPHRVAEGVDAVAERDRRADRVSRSLRFHPIEETRGEDRDSVVRVPRERTGASAKRWKFRRERTSAGLWSVSGAGIRLGGTALPAAGRLRHGVMRTEPERWTGPRGRILRR